VVTYIAPSVDPQRGTVEVRLDVPEPPPYLRPDMTVSVNIEVGRRPAARVVPREAVQDLASSAPWVWRLDGRRAERRGVELGLRGEAQVEIVRGLEDGDRVLVPGGTTLRPGQRVRASQKRGS
jgi:HlyD family secretion protein